MKRSVLVAVVLALLIATGSHPVRSMPVSNATNGRIAFAQQATNNCPSLFTVDFDGSDLWEIVDDCPDVAADPAWNPSADKLALASATPGGPYDPPAPRDIFTSDYDATDRINVTGPDNIADDDPVWSPAGDMIAFARGSQGADSSNIFLLDLELATKTNMTNNAEFTTADHPDWSPTGNQIVYDSKGAPNWDLWMVQAQAPFNKESVTSTDNLHERWPTFSPDGQLIAFARASSSGSEDYDIYVMNADGTGTPIQLTSNSVDDIQPTWSPDGRHIAFTQGCDAAAAAGGATDDCLGNDGPKPADVYRVELNETNTGTVGAPVVVAGGPGAQFDPDWGVPCDACEGPPQVITHPRNLTLQLKHVIVRDVRKLFAKGTLLAEDGYAPCVDHVNVVIQRQTADGWVKITDAETGNPQPGVISNYRSEKFRDRRGTYRAKVGLVTITETDRCGKDRASLTHTHN